jgi:hypothetical protein
MTDERRPEIEQPVRAVARRIRTQRALNAGVLFGVVAAGGVGLCMGLGKASFVSAESTLPWIYGLAALPLVAALVAALLPVRSLGAAQLVDKSHGLKSRLSNALEFLRLPASTRTPFMEAAIADAAAHVREVTPKRAAPFRRPPSLPLLAILVVGVAVVAALEVPREVAVAVEPSLDPLLLNEDDLDSFRSELTDLARQPDVEDEVRVAAREFNQLIEDLADRRLERTEALRRIEELERDILEGREADAETMRESLRQLGEDLRRAELMEDASEALRDADAARAETAVRELAERLRNDEASRPELDELRDALRRATQENQSQREEELRQRREELERLLQRERDKQQESERDRRLLQRRERELDRLRREEQQMSEQRRELERLRRELERAAEDLNRDNGEEQAADSLERGAEDLNRMAREQMTEEQMREMARQLEQLRELLRRERQQGQGQGQDGQSGQGRNGRMQRFVLQARGQGDGESMPVVMPGGENGQGQGQGQGQRGQGQDGQAGQGQGQGGQGGQAGQGQEGQGQGSGPTKALVLGQGGQGNAQLEIPGLGRSQGPQGQGQGQGNEPGGGIGTSHDPTTLDDPTRLQGTRRNMRVEGEASEGPSRSEVILGAADRGFASTPYRDVYTDYENHAEEVLERDEIPSGYRFYVRRYFQLIRPREGEP